MALKTKKDRITGKIYLSIPEFDRLRKRQEKYRRQTNYYNRKKYFDAFHVFLQFFISYANSIITNRPNNDEIAKEIFVKSTDTPNTVFAFLTAMQRYAEFLKDTFTNPKMMNNADSIVFMMLTDCEHLICYSELIMNKTNISRGYWSRRDESPRDIWWALNQLFALPQSVFEDYINVRDVQPITIFLIRQFIETSIYRALGIANIEENGKTAHGLISKTIRFFSDTSLHNGFAIRQPLDHKCLKEIYRCTNTYIHTGMQLPYYVVYFAWLYMRQLIAPSQTSVKIYTGCNSSSVMHGDIQITNYNLMKKAYENYIARGKHKYVVNWLQEASVGAYIISL